MAQTGATPVSLKTETGWRGMSTSEALPGHFDLIENGYVSSDGAEIRSFPGFICVVDPATRVRLYSDRTFMSAPFGYERTVRESQRPPYATVGNYDYSKAYDALYASNQWTWNRPVSIHAVLQANDRWYFIGEGGHRLSPPTNLLGNAILYVTGYRNIVGGTRLTVSDTMLWGSANLQAIYTAKRIYLEGLTGTYAASLNGKSHFILAQNSTTEIDISTALGGTATVTDQTGLIAIVTKTSSQVVSATYDGAEDGISDDKDSLQVWYTTTTPTLDVGSIDAVYPAHVANRQRDYGDIAANINEGTNKFGGTYYAPRSRRRQKSLPFRISPHNAGRSIIVVAPGYGCVFQIPILPPIDPSMASALAGVPWVCNDMLDRPRVLGVPKAICAVDPQVADSPPTNYQYYEAAADTESWGGTGKPERAGVYGFKVAYKDEVTGEVGLCSEPVILESKATDYTRWGFLLFVRFPGYVMAESLAMSINLYRTKKDGDTYYFDRTLKLWAYKVSTPAISAKYGLQPQTTDNDVYHYHAVVYPQYRTDEELGEQVGYVPEVLEQMPMGAVAARTVRGWTVFGGSFGNAGPCNELYYGTLSLEYDKPSFGYGGAFFDFNIVTSAFSFTNPPTNNFSGVDSAFGCALHGIPPGYMGQWLYSSTLFPYPRQLVRLNKVVNTITGNVDYFRDFRYEVEDTPLDPTLGTGGWNAIKATYLVLPRGILQVSEGDNPGVTPATNVVTVCPESAIEGIGDASGTLVVASRHKTYMIGFGSSPVGAVSETVSDMFGCIAANSMVSFGDGCAWIGDCGPVASMGGTIQWIGEPLARLFAREGGRYLRDKDGMMRHSWACHDAERGLLLFGMFADRARGTSDVVSVLYRGTSYTWLQADNYSTSREIKSRFPCDEVLIYNYRSQAWSVWRPPLWLPVQWMTNGHTRDGVNRIHFLGHDKRLYVLDDAYGILDKESNYVELTLSGSQTNIQSAGIATGLRIRVGQDVAFYSGGGTTPLSLIGLRTVATIVDVDEFTLSSAITLPAGGCKMVVGPRIMTIRSTFGNWKKGEAASVSKVGVRYSLWSMLSQTGDTYYDAQATFWSVDGTSSTSRDRVTTPVTQSLTTDSNGAYQPLAESSGDEQVFERDSANGRITGKNTQVEYVFVGGAQVRVSDLYVEVQ